VKISQTLCFLKGKIILIGSLVLNIGRKIATFFHFSRKGVLLEGVAGI